MKFAFQRVVRLALKELREILRDRRTIVTLIAMPLLLYPLMSVAFQQFYLASRITPDSGLVNRIGVVSSNEVRTFQQRFDQGRAAWRRARGTPPEPKEGDKRPAGPQIVWFQADLPKDNDQRTRSLEYLK